MSLTTKLTKTALSTSLLLKESPSLQQAKSLSQQPIPGIQTWYKTKPSQVNSQQLYADKIFFQNLLNGKQGTIILDESFPSRDSKVAVRLDDSLHMRGDDRAVIMKGSENDDFSLREVVMRVKNL